MQKRTVLISGAGRGIGLAMAIRFAAAGDKVAMLMRDNSEHAQEVTAQIRQAGGQILFLEVDLADVKQIEAAVVKTVEEFGGLDILINNKSATVFTNTLQTRPEEFDFAVSTSFRLTYFLSQICTPYLRKSSLAHIINISPPLLLDPLWFKDHLAFSLCKYAMSLCTLGMAEELRADAICVNSLWPQTTIATQTIKEHFAPQVFAGSRWPSIMADAAYELASRQCTGHFFTDEVLLREAGVTDFSPYAVDSTVPLMQALFIPKEGDRQTVTQKFFLSPKELP